MEKTKLQAKIIAYLEEKAMRPLPASFLAKVIVPSKEDVSFFYEALEDLEKEALIIKNRHGLYGLPWQMNLVVGTLNMTTKGFGFVKARSEKDPEVFIARGLLYTALNGDEVLVRLLPPNMERKSPEGEIIRVLKRKNIRIVGTFAGTKSFSFVTPDDKKISKDIFIAKDGSLGATSGDKVVIEITDFGDTRRSPEGKVIEILGKYGEKGVDIISIMRRYELEEDFPLEVKQEAENISQKIFKKDSKGRIDRRSLPLVTIDGKDAKDLDDGIYARKNADDTYLVGIYIADVSNYVKENTFLDKEAQKRGTSVYLVDRVLPMLPKELSNGICSLNVGEDRLAFALELILAKNGAVLDYRLFKTLIRVKHRLTYEEVDAYLAGEDSALATVSVDIKEMLATCLKVRNLRKKKRLLRGAIDFDLPETKVILDTYGNPLFLEKHVGTIAESIIEEFMLLANETVAKHLVEEKIPSVYRVHESPTKEKITDFNTLLAMFGEHIRLEDTGEVQPKEIARVLKKVENRPEEKLIKTICLRSMQQARYTAENMGHFALASKYYTHFTSPIRRYSDLLVHRFLTEIILQGKMSKKRQEHLANNLPAITEHLSVRERIAIDAERATTELKKVEYMSRFLGEAFQGIISSVTNFGLFVELLNGVEGLVHISSMVNDFYHFDAERYLLVGEHTKKIYRLGDEVEVILLKASLEEQTLDFILKDNGIYQGKSAKKSTEGFSKKSKKTPIIATIYPPRKKQQGKKKRGKKTKK